MPTNPTHKDDDSEKPPRLDDASFIIVWGYLMIVSIALAPLIAFAIRSALS